MHLPKAWHVLSPSWRCPETLWSGTDYVLADTLEPKTYWTVVPRGVFLTSSGSFSLKTRGQTISGCPLFHIQTNPIQFFYVWLLENHNEHHPNRWLIWACRFQKQLKSWRNYRPPHPAWKAEAVRSNRNECIIANLNTICRRRHAKIIPFVPCFFPFTHSVLKVYSLEVWWSPVMHAVWVNLGWHLCSSLFFPCMGFSHTQTLSVKVFVFLRCVTPWELKSYALAWTCCVAETKSNQQDCLPLCCCSAA